jgi:hypothetical protein
MPCGWADGLARFFFGLLLPFLIRRAPVPRPGTIAPAFDHLLFERLFAVREGNDLAPGSAEILIKAFGVDLGKGTEIIRLGCTRQTLDGFAGVNDYPSLCP